MAVPTGRAGELSTQVERPDPLLAPVARDQQVGTLQVKLGEQVLATRPLLALEAVNEAGFFRRIWDTIMLWFK